MNHRQSLRQRLGPNRARSGKRTARVGTLLVMAIAVWATSIQPVQSQTKRTPSRSRKKPTPKFEDVTLATRDGVALRCTYYAGPETKQTVPMILVHDWEGSRGQLHPVALWMQQNLRLSVLVPDLRGHGNSTRRQGFDASIDPSKFKRTAMDNMTWDIEACKTFLLKRNNEGKVNIEQLGVLGVGFGATLAVKWSVRDWSAPDLPNYKQSRDVKALILVSPRRSFRGMTLNLELKQHVILGHISTLTIVGSQDSRSLSDAKRIHKAIERAWGKKSREAAPFLEADTPLQGTGLLRSRGLGVDRWIDTFIKRRLIPLAQQFPWTDRTSPLE